MYSNFVLSFFICADFMSNKGYYYLLTAVLAKHVLFVATSVLLVHVSATAEKLSIRNLYDLVGMNMYHSAPEMT